MNNENLVSLGDRDPERAKEIQRAGGIKSGQNRKRNADIRNSLKMLMGMDAKSIVPEDAQKMLGELGVKDPTMAEALAAVAFLKSCKGDVEAMRFVRDSSGELPTSKVELSGDLGKPIAGMDLTQLTDDQLRQLAEKAD